MSAIGRGLEHAVHAPWVCHSCSVLTFSFHRWGNRGQKDPGHIIQARRKMHISCLLVQGSRTQPACPFPQDSLGGAEPRGR